MIMARPRKTERPETVLDAMGPDMNEETSNGRGEDEVEEEETKT
jgi:hypothetical protein